MANRATWRRQRLQGPGCGQVQKQGHSSQEERVMVATIDIRVSKKGESRLALYGIIWHKSMQSKVSGKDC